MARLVPCLVQLRGEFDACFPGRDRASDGWIADAAHSAGSDHQPDGRGLVHAIDVDAGLGSPIGDVVRHLVARKDRRLTYIIHARTIWSASHGWNPRKYDGPNPHIEHAHISAADDPELEQDTRSFHLEEVPVALTAADKEWIAAEIRRVVTGDADPSDRVYSLGGMVTTIERRTDALTRAVAELPARVAAEVAKTPPPAG